MSTEQYVDLMVRYLLALSGLVMLNGLVGIGFEIGKFLSRPIR